MPLPSHSRSLPWLACAGLAGTVLSTGCARAVLPSEKVFLADPIMQFDEDALETAADGHVATNREGAAGGSAAAGGGCGCN